MPTRIGPVTLLLLAAAAALSAKDSCFDCHSVEEGTSVPFRGDIHYQNGISCAGCHGGDPNSDDPNVSMSAERGFKLRVTREAASAFCAHCHSDAAVIHKSSPGQRVDQMALYLTSVHAVKPAGSDSIAANCIDCHGIHNIRAVSDPQSPVAPGRLAATCGKCHRDSAALFQKSAHAALFTTADRPACATCHAGHATQRAGVEMLAGGRAVCARCHEPDTKPGKTAAAMERTFDQSTMAAFTAMTAAGGRGGEARQAQITERGPAMNQVFAALARRMQKARSAVHSLDPAAVKAAAEAAIATQP